MAAAPAAGGVLPARLGYLTIFNPSLGTSDDTVDDQIVYYASIHTQHYKLRKRRNKPPSGDPTQQISAEERHSRLRQIGLAQGMTDFSRGFSNGASVDSIDTEMSKVILHELEPGWWLLAVCSRSSTFSAPTVEG